jgi:hypothetical protein
VPAYIFSGPTYTTTTIPLELHCLYLYGSYNSSRICALNAVFQHFKLRFIEISVACAIGPSVNPL